MIRTTGFIVGILLTAATLADAFAAEIVIIANPAYPVQKIQLADLKKIYLGEKLYEGSMVLKPMDQADLNPIKKVFIEKVLVLSVEYYKGYWLKRVFREGSIPPAVKPSSREVIATVESETGAIGYVWAEEVGGKQDLKILLRVHVD